MIQVAEAGKFAGRVALKVGAIVGAGFLLGWGDEYGRRAAARRHRAVTSRTVRKKIKRKR